MDADRLNFLGHEAMTQGQIDTAYQYFEKAIEANPLLPQSHYNLGVCLMARGEYDKALKSYRKTLSLSPQNTMTLNNIGVTYQYMGEIKKAQYYFRKALKKDKTNLLALTNIGGYYLNLNPKKALNYFNKANKINPDIADVNYSLGICLLHLGDKKALYHFKKAVKLNPDYGPSWTHYYHQLRSNCDWKNAKAVAKEMKIRTDEHIERGILPPHTAFSSAIYQNNLKENFKIARIWSTYMQSRVQFEPYPNKITKNKKIKIGYLSSDFNNHATSHLLLGVLAAHNKEKYDIYAYSYGVNDKSFYRKMIEKLTIFVDIKALSPQKAADRINSDKIDILVDLKGQTQGSKFEIICLKPAPIIISWLGFPGTTGSYLVDYIITDKVITKKSDLKYYSEKPIFMPFTYQPTDNQQQIQKDLEKKDFKLPQNGFLFCNFGSAYKITQDVFSSWMNILNKVPGSYLILLKQNKNQVKYLHSQAKKAGVDKKRIVFCPSLPEEKHLARVSLCDLALDTNPCNGHTTTSDSLWAGVPVISIKGNHFASRVSESILSAIDLSEMVTKNLSSYEKLAISLAKDLGKLKMIKYKLLANRQTFPLFDTNKFTKDLETSFSKVYERYQKGLDPAAISIKSAISKKSLSMSKNNLGVYLSDEKQYKDSAKLLTSAVKLDPKNALAYNNLGTLYKSLNKPTLAEKYWLKSFRLNPKLVDPLNNLGVYFLDKGQNKKAITYFEKALTLEPKNASIYGNIGVAYLNSRQFPKAVSYLKRSIKLNPQDPRSHYHLGLTYQMTNKVEESVKSLRNVFNIYPEFGPALSVYLQLLLQTCDWDNSEKVIGQIEKVTDKEIRSKTSISISPFVNVITHMDPKYNLLVAKSKNKQIEEKVKGLLPPFSFSKNVKHKKIRLGYLSRDYFDHATAFLISALFETHNRKNFDVYAYSYGPNDKGYYRNKLEKDADVFRDIIDNDFVESAKIINNDEIDILIDLKGHTRENRLEIASLKPSPIIVSYLGFPGTLGADYIDYVITDKIVTPKSQQKYYTEKFAYMPHCYQINDNKRPIANINYQRASFNLPENAFVFSCFNHSTKINPRTFKSWVRILKRVPNSVLWLLSNSALPEKNLVKHAKKAGINPKRLVFANYMANENHLARLSLSNLGLDTFTYNGHTTTSDSLWASVPVITLKGKHFASRVATSILSAAGLPELITKTEKEYENLAVSLANNPEELKTIKQKLIINRMNCPLFDTSTFIKDMESLYKQMWKGYLKNQKQKLLSL